MPHKADHPLSVGKPQKKIDWDQVKDLITAGCLGTEIAGIIGVSTSTLYNRCMQEHGTNYSDFCQTYKAKGDGIIRVKQYELAVKQKDRQMLLWLGKVRLKQTDIDAEKINEKLEGLRNAIAELSGTENNRSVSRAGQPGEQRVEDEPPLQDQGSTRQMPDAEAELGSDRADEGQASLPADTES